MWVFAGRKYIGLQKPQCKHCRGVMNTRPGSCLVFKAHSDLPANFHAEGHQKPILRVLAATAAHFEDTAQ